MRKSTPCPCAGCQSGRHPKTGLKCRFCSGKGYVMDGDWPSPCWEGYWSGHLPPAPGSPQHPSASTKPTLDTELDKWLTIRNALSTWENSNREGFAQVAVEVTGWTEWLTNELSAVEEGVAEMTLTVRDLDDLVASIGEFLRLNGKHVVHLSRLSEATDVMFHALGWTEPTKGG
ncbi:hypothetical protein FHX52_2227 [Humibacillus xanthopallidus]|uniref:Uncharacterized protein n=2 Tax=Humibacillus xanthopallidus TaxID=412689 RepID=A0A543PYA5_9MICO|nr:hypothetical protein FHX52_2227 [Humibacillus xanthopallidus]